jgi:hypothetical protein
VADLADLRNVHPGHSLSGMLRSNQTPRPTFFPLIDCGSLQ